jgi:hypothetical protein
VSFPGDLGDPTFLLPSLLLTGPIGQTATGQVVF